MKNLLLTALVLTTAASAAACKKKEEEKKADPAAPTTPTTATKPADPVPTPTPTPAATDKEVDLAPWGPEFAGYVAMVPDGTKVEFDDPSRQLTLGNDNGDYVNVGEAPGWDDAVKGLAADADNSEIKSISPTEVRWMRNPPLGKQWNFDLKIDVGGKPYSCNGNTFTDAAMADKLIGICKSIKKK